MTERHDDRGQPLGRPRRKPTYWSVLIPLLMGLGACAGGLAMTAQRVQEMPRMVVPGEARIVLGAGSYLVFLEGRSVVGGEAVSGNPAVRCAVARAGGEAIALSPPGYELTYSLGGYAGEAVFALKIPTGGAYEVACEGSGPGALAFGRGLGALLLVAIGGGLGGPLLAIFWWWRVRRRRKAFDAERARLPAAQVR